MNYETNRAILTEVVNEKAIIRHVSKHRKPDGTMDVEGNLQLWNNVMSRFEQIPLWEDGAPGFDDRDPNQLQPFMVFVPAQKSEAPRGTIVVAHGGGFMTRTGCEGVHVADFFNKAGFNVAILSYRLVPYSRIDAMNDMHRAIRILRHRKDELGISDKVAAMGFSAGGMLSGNCATHFDYGNTDAADSIEHNSNRPDAAVICYGAFTTVSIPGSFMNNPFKDKDRAEKVYLAPEKNITSDTPPFFIWQTISDDPRLSFILGKALTENGIPFELHCFPDGVHGLALADGNNDLDITVPHLMHWSTLCAEWLEGLGF